MASGGDGPEFESRSRCGIFKNFVKFQALSNVSVTEYELPLENQKTRRVGNL